jgi:hypothetical protein
MLLFAHIIQLESKKEYGCQKWEINELECAEYCDAGLGKLKGG